MSAYYNENEPFKIAKLKKLISAGLIADGEVDGRGIQEVQPEDIRGFKQCHFFAGVGVWSFALRRAGWSDEHPVWTGSCPCKSFSKSGRREGFSDRHHLWPEWLRLIREHHPHVLFGEQVADKDGLAWLDVVSAELEAEDYAIGATDLCAAGFGAPHIRQRLYFVARSLGMGHAIGEGLEGQPWNVAHRKESRRLEAEEDGPACEAGSARAPGEINGFWREAEWLRCIDGKERPIESGTFPLADGPSERMGRIISYGDALVAPVAQGFIEAFMEVESERKEGWEND